MRVNLCITVLNGLGRDVVGGGRFLSLPGVGGRGGEPPGENSIDHLEKSCSAILNSDVCYGVYDQTFSFI